LPRLRINQSTGRIAYHYKKELDYAIDELDDLVKYLATRLDEILQPLEASYKILSEESRNP
jgi:hypothetical protein